eukprot:TRINITY_DN6666_c0_g1_i3.p1 TRINITY_DN6666_c0_g1~~TRINITY_DN6666_c0_g1_i3.p1  ORF type:complete len:130 (+),score=0.04 TRINITY_DN6666_c0_g1_i3:194-583(+)
MILYKSSIMIIRISSEYRQKLKLFFFLFFRIYRLILTSLQAFFPMLLAQRPYFVPYQQVTGVTCLSSQPHQSQHPSGLQGQTEEILAYGYKIMRLLASAISFNQLCVTNYSPILLKFISHPCNAPCTLR